MPLRAHSYGTPTILSSYEFSGYDDGAPNNGMLFSFVEIIRHLSTDSSSGTGTCSADGGENGW